MPAWVPVLVTIGIALGAASLGFAFKTYRAIATHEAQYVEHSKQLACIPDLQQRMARSEQNDEIFWKIMGPHMSSVIQSPEHLTRDHLIRKLDEGHLGYPEGLELSSLLGHAFEEERDPDRKMAIAFKLAQVRCWLSDRDREKARAEQQLTGDAKGCSRHKAPTS
jgi:hypothetical protein